MTKEQIAAKAKERDKLLEEVEANFEAAEKKAADEGRDLTDEERQQFEDGVAQVEAMTAEIDKANADVMRKARLGAIRESSKQSIGRLVPMEEPGRMPSAPGTKPPAQVRTSYSKMFRDDHNYRGDEKAYALGMIGCVLGGHGNEEHRQWLADRFGVRYAATLQSSVNTAGGALIPDEFRPDLILLIEERGTFRANAMRWTMNSDTLLVPRVTGGMTATWTTESTNVTTSDPTFDVVQLTAKKLSTGVLVPDELLEDASVELGDVIARLATRGLADAEDEAGFNGDGTSTYGGIHGAAVKINDGNHASSIYTAASGNTAFSTLDLEDFEGVVGSLPMFGASTPRWYISKAGAWASMFRLADSAGGNTQSNIANGPMMEFLGAPVVFTQVLNSTLTADTSAIKALYGHLDMAASFGDRRALRIASDGGGKYFEAGQRLFKIEERVDINVHTLDGDIDSGAGPLIALKTPGS